MNKELNFAKNVERLAKSFGMSLDNKEMAMSAGMSKHQLKALLRYNSPRLKTVVRLAKAWDVSVIDLICGPHDGEYCSYHMAPALLENVRALARRNGYTLEEMAVQQGMTSQTFVHQLQRGNPQIRLLPRLAEALGCELWEIL